MKLIIDIPEWKYKSICDGVKASKSCGVVGKSPSIHEAIYNGALLDDVKGTKYYKADDVMKVLLDNDFGDEENGADPEYMTALWDVYRGLENISVYAVPERETGGWIYCGNSSVNGLKICECTKCHKRNYGSHNFCPNCGVDMRRQY